MSCKHARKSGKRKHESEEEHHDKQKKDEDHGKRKKDEEHDTEAESGEDNMDDLLLNIILAAENLAGPATPEVLRLSLEQNFDVRTTNSKIELALDNGMKLGVIQEQTKYKLHPEFKSVKDKSRIKKEGEDEQEGFSCPEASDDDEDLAAEGDDDCDGEGEGEGQSKGEGEGEGEGEGSAEKEAAGGDDDGDDEGEGDDGDDIDVDVDVDDDDDGDEEDYKCEVQKEDPHHKCKKQRRC